MRILALVGGMAHTLDESMFHFEQVEDEDDLISILAHDDCDAVVADKRLNVKRLRVSSDVPLIMLGGSEIELLNAGADAVVPFPVNPLLLMAKILAVTRRVANCSGNIIKYGEYTCDMLHREVWHGITRMNLTKSEYPLMECLIKNKGRLATKQHMYEYLYGFDTDTELKIIDVFICRIRSQLPKGSIETIWGQGYRLA